MTNCSFQTKHGKVSFRAKKCNGTRTPAKKAPAKKAPASAPAPTRKSSRAGRTPMGRHTS